jgi:hypothetical protein
MLLVAGSTPDDRQHLGANKEGYSRPSSAQVLSPALGEHARQEGNSLIAMTRNNRVMLVEPGIDSSGTAVRDF